MDTSIYLDDFKNASLQIDSKQLQRKKLLAAVGFYGQSIFLKLFKASWANPGTDPIHSPSRIFFTIWLDEHDTEEKKLYYNIHALKLRLLKGYSIQSRGFAQRFRQEFAGRKKDWPNLSIDFGPLTLMQGWVPLQPENLTKDIAKLSKQFIAMHHIIDDVLAEYKK